MIEPKLGDTVTFQGISGKCVKDTVELGDGCVFGPCTTCSHKIACSRDIRSDKTSVKFV